MDRRYLGRRAATMTSATAAAPTLLLLLASACAGAPPEGPGGGNGATRVTDLPYVNATTGGTSGGSTVPPPGGAGGSTGTTSGGTPAPQPMGNPNVVASGAIAGAAFTAMDAAFANGTVQGRPVVFLVVSDHPDACGSVAAITGAVNVITVQIETVSKTVPGANTYTVYDLSKILPSSAKQIDTVAGVTFEAGGKASSDYAATGTVTLQQMTAQSITVILDATSANNSSITGTVTAAPCAALAGKLTG